MPSYIVKLCLYETFIKLCDSTYMGDCLIVKIITINNVFRFFANHIGDRNYYLVIFRTKKIIQKSWMILPFYKVC